jgi:hypothetical protein
MGRLFVVLLIALGAGLYFPESRAIIIEYVRPLSTPPYRWMTHQELNQIVSDLEVVQESGRPFPARPDEFNAWLASRYPQERSRVDAWGTPYRIELTATHFRVVSAGSDRVFGTDRDLFREAPRQAGTR